MERCRMPVVDDTPRAADRPPRSWDRFAGEFPAVVAAYDALSDVCRQAGPLDPTTINLVKLAVSVGRGSERTVHAHAKKALRAGVDPDALRQIAVVSLPTIGLPAALDALRWVDESIREALPATRAK